MTTIKGITKRWFFNTLGLLLIILLAIVTTFALFVRGYFYNGIQQTIIGRSNELTNVFSGYASQSLSNFNKSVYKYVENFPDKGLMELMVFDNTGGIVITSTGFAPDTSQPMPDYDAAKTSNYNYGIWTGKLSSGEPVTAVTRAIYSPSGEYFGSIRYIVSLENADSKIAWSVLLLLLISFFIILFVIISGSYFIKSILVPVREITRTAKRIALGDFRAKINKRYDDEIGELCDTINYMADELGTAEQMKNDFISSVSHELRTPLTAIKGWAETMQLGEQIDKETAKKGIKIIIREAERLSGIVEELLDFSRIQSDRMVLMMDKIDILAEIGEAVYMFKERALSENKTLKYNEPVMLSPVLGDKNKLRQVFINILDNAFKYTPSGGMIIVNASEKDSKIFVNVTDNGCGIPAEHLPKIKEKFYKANQTQRGSGIGLAVADEIIKMHSGALDIASEEDLGTTVTISIPTINEEIEENDIQENGDEF